MDSNEVRTRHGEELRLNLSNTRTGFWQFSCRLYAIPKVSETCLILQDRYGLDVNLILFALWSASQHRQLSSQLLKKTAQFSRHWQRQRVMPLRELRRRMKSRLSLIAEQRQRDYAQLRESILTTELGAERLQQQVLARLAATEPALVSRQEVAATMRANLQAVCAESGVEADSQLQTLLAGLVTSAAPARK